MSAENRFIISGGYINLGPDEGKKYCEEVVKGIGHKPIRVLESLFAQAEENWEAAFEKDRSFFSRILPDISLQLSIANQTSFISQLDNVDVLIIHGGSPKLLLEFLGDKDKLNEHFHGKTVVGHSAGAYALSQYYLHINDEGIMELKEGLGYLPIKTVVHYGSDFYRLKYPKIFTWEKVDEFMQQNKPELEYVKLHEGEFRVFSIDSTKINSIE